MARIILISFILCVVVHLTTQGPSTPDSRTYKAGVVEYEPSVDPDLAKRITDNIKEYKKLISDAKVKDLDIIVFPEATLNSANANRGDAITITATTVPAPSEGKVPCTPPKSPTDDKYDEIMRTLSCAAKESNIYVVVNLSEKEHCSKDSQAAANDDRPCADDSWNVFNTDVVFDRNGTVIARYRKFNLFGEKTYNTTRTAEHVTFETDFGVTFGLFTCFDILFNEPTLGLVRKGVKDFVFPTMWFSELPFLTALQIQEYWAHTNDVNLLASGASNTTVGSGGSGIYAGSRGPLDRFISYPGGKNNSRLLAANVTKLKSTTTSSNVVLHHVTPSQKIENPEEENYPMDAFAMLRDKIDKYTSEIIGDTFSKELCSADLCCTFNVTSHLLKKTEGKVNYQYRAIVGDIIRSFSGVTNGGIKSCALVACTSDDFKTCAVRFEDSSNVAPLRVFDSIHIYGNFPAIDEVLTMPNTLAHNMHPLVAGSFYYDEIKEDGEEKKKVSIKLRGLPVDDLQTFGIFGRDFRGDGNSSSTLRSSFALILTILSYISIKYLFNV